MRILGALIILAGFLLFALAQYFPAFICIVMGSIFMGKPKVQREEEEEGQDGELVRVDTPLRKVRKANAEHRRLAFPVAGVTRNNDDGSSRQAALEALCEGDDMAVADVWFDDYLFGGRLNIRVMTEQGCVGEIRQKDVATVRTYFEKEVRMIYLEINRDTEDGGDGVYQADVVIIEETEAEEAEPEPEQEED